MAEIAYIVFSLICVVFNIAPLCWQIEQKNSGPICLGFWVILHNLLNFVNAVVWRNDAINRAPIWCDISVKLYLAGPIGVSCASICIARFLASILRPPTSQKSLPNTRAWAAFDYCLCFGLPAFIMATHIVYQPNRFEIAKGLGCLTTFVISWPTYVLYLIWLPLLAAVGCLFSVRLVQHRRHLQKMLGNAPSAITQSRFIRLLLLSVVYFAVILPFSIYQSVLIVETLGPYYDYDWDFLHQAFGVVTFAPFNSGTGFAQWSAIVSGLLVLVFFGFAGEATSYYKKLFLLMRGDRAWSYLRDSVSLCMTGRPFSRKPVKPERELVTVGKRESGSTLSPYYIDLPSATSTRQSEKGFEKDSYSGPFSDVEMASAEHTMPRLTISRAEDRV